MPFGSEQKCNDLQRKVRIFGGRRGSSEFDSGFVKNSRLDYLTACCDESNMSES